MTDGVMMLPVGLLRKYPVDVVMREARAAAARWGKPNPRIYWLGGLPPVPAKAAHRRRYGR